MLVHATPDVGTPETPLATTVYFARPGRVSLFEPPTPCPGYPPLQLAGIAVDDHDGLYLVVDVHGVRAWLGPSLREVRRKANLVAGAVNSRLDPQLADWRGVLEWLTDAWGVAVAPDYPDLLVREDEEARWLDAVTSHRNEPPTTDTIATPRLAAMDDWMS